MVRVQTTGDSLVSEEELRDISVSDGVELKYRCAVGTRRKMVIYGKENYLNGHHLIANFISSSTSEKEYSHYSLTKIKQIWA